jgi:Peptidase C39 family
VNGSMPKIIWAGVFCSLATAGCYASIGDDSSSDANYDCGTLALYTLLRLEDYRGNIRAIDAALPPRSAAGYTMMEIKNACTACGLPVRGVQLRKGDKLPNHGMIAFVRRDGHGHYVVIRPVGHTGKLVQIIDPGRKLEVLDALDLWSSSEWTGLALVPNRSGHYVWIAGGASAVLFGLGLACQFRGKGASQSRSAHRLSRSAIAEIEPS